LALLLLTLSHLFSPLSSAPGDKSDEEDEASATAGDGLADSIRDYLTHTDAVYCVSFNKTGTSFVSGGGDDVGYIWNTDSAEPKVKLEGKNFFSDFVRLVSKLTSHLQVIRTRLSVQLSVQMENTLQLLV